MFTDALLTCSDDQDLSAMNANDEVLSDKSVDLQAAGVDTLGNTNRTDAGAGSNIGVICQVTTAFAGAGGATITAELVMADNEALDSNLVVVQKTDAIPVATAKAGYQFRFDGIPPGTTKQFLGFRFRNLTADLSAGKVHAGFVLDKQTNGYAV